MRIYFALISIVTLCILMFGLIDILRIGLKAYVFPAADVPTYLESCEPGSGRFIEPKPVATPEEVEQPSIEEQQAQCEARNADALENYQRAKADSAVRNLAMIIVSLPLFILHFRIVFRDWREEKKAN